MALYGATIGKLGILTFPAATNQACANVIPLADLIDPKYLFFYLRSERETLIEKGQGGAQPNISQEIVRAHPILLAPLAEQRRIVAKLEALLGKVDACKQRLAKIPVLLKRFRQSVLAAACLGRLTSDWRGGNAPKATGIIEDVRRVREKLVVEKRAKKLSSITPISDDELPLGNLADWPVIRLDEVCSLITDGKHGDCRDEDDSGFYFLSAKDLKGWKLNYEGARQIVEADFREVHQRTNLEASDVLISNSGTIGRVAIAQEGEKTRRTTFQKSVAILKPIKSHLDPRFLAFYLAAAIRHIEESSQGTAQKNLLLRDLRNLVLFLPPLAEQQEIVRRVEALFALADQIEARFHAAQTQIDKLTPSLLAKAFRGELVPQDPSDEPASVLLERIREQRNNQPAKQQPRKGASRRRR